MKVKKYLLIWPLGILLLLAACQQSDNTPTTTAVFPSHTPQPTITKTAIPPIPITQSPIPITRSPISNPPTLTPQPTITNTPTPTTTPTPTPLPQCDQRIPSDDNLLTIVTLQYPISKRYEPSDLVPLSDYFNHDITFGYPTEMREIIIVPLVQMIDDMHAAGLQPQIISGYRSHYSQSIAWDKWNKLEPERAIMLSAPPGHSEHQLGTTLDFGSPELAEIVENEDIEFHTYFYKTSEGLWLREHAHEYGFDLSYPREASELTGFFYEPWHFRFIGVELATQLYKEGRSLTAYLMETAVFPPCIKK